MCVCVCVCVCVCARARARLQAYLCTHSPLGSVIAKKVPVGVRACVGSVHKCVCQCGGDTSDQVIEEYASGPGTGVMEADDRQVTTVFTVQPLFHHRHSTDRVSRKRYQRR